MKILLLQLPLQSHDFFFSRENVPLASAYLQVIARQQGIQADLLPEPLMSYGSDQAILQYLLDMKPDLVGMSCYQWNVERSLFIASQFKHHLPSCTIVMGGPEITADNEFLLQHTDFDIGVMGEGEGVWNQLIQSFPRVPSIPGLLFKDEDRQWHESGRQSRRAVLGRWPSPYLTGLLDSYLNSALWIETVRGCVYHCAYCYYHKQSPNLRTFPLERIFQEVERARNQGLQEIVFLDPCFAKHPNLGALLTGMAIRNPDKHLRLYGETNAEAMDQNMAKKMARAGFVRLEVGLQSVNRTALRNINRTFYAERFLQGVRFLQECGIELMVDLIAGLPGDTLSDICYSLDWLKDHQAYDYLMLYALSLIPGTKLRQRASEFGLCAMPNPPCLVTRSPTLTAAAIHQAFCYYEEAIGKEISPLEVPPFLNASSHVTLPAQLQYQIEWSRPEKVQILSHYDSPIAYACTVSMSKEVLKEPRLWVPVLKDHLGKNPFSLLSIEVPPDTSPDELDPLWMLARLRSHLLDRDYTVTHSPYRSFMVVSRSRGLLWKWPDPREYHPVTLHDAQKVHFSPACLVVTPGHEIPGWFIDQIHRRYARPPEIRRWKLSEG